MLARILGINNEVATMSHEVKVHEAQTLILRELLFVPSAGFAELQKPTGLTSDHFTFHINRLLELGLVERESKGLYRLSVKGKEYANRLDTDNNTVERQPKVAVLLAIERTVDGRREMLFQERLKQPYYGYWGLPSGKIRWGETIMECAARELDEETGLQAEFNIQGVYHEHALAAADGTILEDKVFFLMRGVNTTGELKENFEGGRNAWMTPTEARAQPKVFGSFDTEMDMALAQNPGFVEAAHHVSAEDF